MALSAEEQRRLGGELAKVLDRYGVIGADRVWVMLHAAWGEAQSIQMSSITLAGNAMQVWKPESEAKTNFYTR